MKQTDNKETFKKLEDYFKSKGAFDTKLPYIIDIMSKSIPDNVPKNLALTMVLSEVAKFVNQYRNTIRLNTPSKKVETLVPTNLYLFGLSPSGISKDSTKNTLRKLLKGGYSNLDKLIKLHLISDAKKVALSEGFEESEYHQFMKSQLDTDIKLAGGSTYKGVSQDISDIGNMQRLGSPTVISSEIGDDMGSEATGEIFTTLGEIYDLGTYTFGSTKDKSLKIKPIKNLPVDLLVFGSEQGILLDSSNKNKFKKIFGTKYSRRCILTFTRYTPVENLPDNIDDLLASINDKSVKIGEHYDDIYDYFVELSEAMPNNTKLAISKEAQDLFDLYLIYNKLKADTIPTKLPLSSLARKHKQWVALKLSGIYALLDDKVTIEEDHYIDAIRTIEMLSEDLELFEVELEKEPYEILHTIASNEGGDYFIDAHTLKKNNFIEGKGNTEAKMKQLVYDLNSIATDGIYYIEGVGIKYEEQIHSETTGVSIKEIDTSRLAKAIERKADSKVIKRIKSELASEGVYGFRYVETEFAEYSELLKEDMMYSPFKFKTKEEGAVYDEKKHPNPKDGIRGADNIIGGTKFVVLDIDESYITDEEAHELLEGINHHIARTSDPDNAFKFRVLIELDNVVTLDGFTWRYFIEEIGKELGLTCDLVAQSQLYFTFARERVLSCIDGLPLETKDLIVKARERKDMKESAKPISSTEKSKLLKNPLDTFSMAYYYNKPSGLATKMIAAAKLAVELGADKEYVLNLVKDIQDKTDYPIEESKFERTFIQYINRWNI
jgi:hypothetical protein